MMSEHWDILREVAEDLGQSIAQVDAAVSGYFHRLLQRVHEGKDVRVPSIAGFSVGNRKARQGRNLRTGAPLEVPAARVLRVKPAKAVRELLNQ